MFLEGEELAHWEGAIADFGIDEALGRFEFQGGLWWVILGLYLEELSAQESAIGEEMVGEKIGDS